MNQSQQTRSRLAAAPFILVGGRVVPGSKALDNLFDSRHRAELRVALKRREIPVKFEYVAAEPAVLFDVMHSVGYHVPRLEYDLLSRNLGKLLYHIPADLRVVVDLGCGTGEKAIPILEDLVGRHRLPKYIPMDISDRLIERAAETVREAVPGVEIAKVQTVDFEDGHFRDVLDGENGDTPHLLLLLGHTLGNPEDRQQLLANIRDSMAPNDWLLVGVELLPEQDRDVQHIEGEYKETSVKELVTSCIRLMGVDVENDGNYDAVYNNERQQVEMLFTFTRPCTICFDESQFHFEPGNELLLAVSYKFKGAELDSLFREARLKIIERWYEPELGEHRYCLLVARVKPFRENPHDGI